MIRRSLLLLVLFPSCLLAAETIPAAHRSLRDNFSDTWSATDALGRTLPRFDQVGAPRANRYVGMFYFLWQDSSEKEGPFDVSKILAKDPTALMKNTSLRLGVRSLNSTTGASRSLGITWRTMNGSFASTHRCWLTRAST